MEVSVVITTYNRADLISRAVTSVQQQRGVDFEVVVVDDGSTDGTQEVLGRLADSRTHVISRQNGGLGAARNDGVGRSRGRWIAFLDDDDWVRPGWLACLLQLTGPGVGVVFCGVEYVDTSGNSLGFGEPQPMGSLFGCQTGLVLAGAWLVRADLLHDVGGYDTRLTCSHQTDLLIRVLNEASSRGLVSRYTSEPFVCIERRSVVERPMSSPRALYDGTKILLDVHRSRLRTERNARARWNSVLGVSAARLGLFGEARRAFGAAVAAQPQDPAHWFRLCAAMVPAVARHTWHSDIVGRGR